MGPPACPERGGGSKLLLERVNDANSGRAPALIAVIGVGLR
jgi:hypothetical protein